MSASLNLPGPVVTESPAHQGASQGEGAPISQVVALSPTATRTPSPVPTPTPKRADAPAPPGANAEASAPTGDPISLSTYWTRIHELMFVPAIDNLTPLPVAKRNDPLFGVANALSTGSAPAPVLRGMGASVDRIEVRWDMLEPTPGVFDFKEMDETFKLNSDLDFSVLAVVDGTPQWAVAPGWPHGNSPPMGLDQPAFLANGNVNPDNLWASFVSVVATRYSKHIAAWEIWNEPDTPDFWNGTPAQYARLLTVAHDVLARLEPDAPVLVGGLAIGDDVFLSDVVSTLCPAGPCPHAFPRAIAWHVYNNPQDIPRLVTLTRAIMQEHNVTPEVWITESNVPVIDPQAPADAVDGPDAVTLEQQAAFVLQAYVLARETGVHTLVIYRASDVADRGHYWGLLRHNFSARPALFAFRAAAQWLSGTRPLGVAQPSPGVTVAAFCSPTRNVLVLWNSAPTAAVTMLRLRAGAQRVNAVGEAQPLQIVGGLATVALPATLPGTDVTVPLGSPVIVATQGGC